MEVVQPEVVQTVQNGRPLDSKKRQTFQCHGVLNSHQISNPIVIMENTGKFTYIYQFIAF